MITIDTRHGTNNQYSFSHGNCLPYTGIPFGMNYFAPQTTDQKDSWWFHPEDRTFQGYRLTHQPSPWMGDFSHLIFQPLSGKIEQQQLFHAQTSYRPEESIFQPSMLKIKSCRYQLVSQLIPSMYGGILVMEGSMDDAGLGLFLPGRYKLQQTDAHTLKGEIINFSGSEDPDFTFYFTLSFKESVKTIEGDLSGEDSFIIIRFGMLNCQEIRLGTSFISHEQAALNLKREQKQTVCEYLKNSQNKWQEYLNRIKVEHHDKNQVNTFYHNMYRMFLFPQTFYETNARGEKIHYDTYNKKIRPGVLYTNNGFWDTYKTVYPLFSLIAQEKYEEILEGLLNSYRETGFLPKWLSPDERGLMPGTLVDAVIADAAAKDIRLDLMPEFLEAMKKGATIQATDSKYGRQGTKDYLTYGFVPADYHESVNHTLDYCYSDYCIQKVAERLSDPEADFYRSQAMNYRHILDPQTKFMRAKDKQGCFREPFDSHSWGKDYAEGSAWQNSFAVYHDFAGLIKLYGGEDAFQQKLIELCNQAPVYRTTGYGFEIHEMSEMAAVEFGQLAISNQPSFHLPYLFSYIGKPEMAQPLLKQLMTRCFSANPSGYPGDEDNGSMAGWFIFNSLGFYPVCPGSGEYVIGLPLFDQVTVYFSNGNKLTLRSNPNHSQQQFLHEVKLNDESYEKLFFSHETLVKGGQIDFHLGIVPTPRDYKQADYPYSLSK